MDESLRFEHVSGGYPGHEVFNDLNLQFPQGAFIALTGPNGSGKSTMLKFIYKQLKPSQGAVYIGNMDSRNLTQKELAKHLGFIAQHGKLDYAFTVREAVSMGRFAYDGKDEDLYIERSMQACDILQLSETLVTELSGGELQRVLLARALSQNGKLLLLDEPVNHLDVAHQRSIMQLLSTLVSKGYTVVCVLHDLLLVQVYSQMAMVLKNGSIVTYGSTETVFSEHLIEEVYHIKAHQVYDSSLDRTLWMPSWY